MGKTWGDDRIPGENPIAELQRQARIRERTAEEHAMAAHVDEALNTHELYDQDLEVPENPVEIRTWGDITILPSRCGLCGTLFQNPPWDPEQGSLCSVCGATTKVSR